MKRFLTFLLLMSSGFYTSWAWADSTIIMTPSNRNGAVYIDQRNRVFEPDRGGAYNAGRATGFIANGFPNNTVTIQNGNGGQGNTVFYSNGQNNTLNNGMSGIVNNGQSPNMVPQSDNGGGIMIYGADGRQTGTYSGGRFTPTP